MATLTGKSIATTYDQLWFRSTTAPGGTTNTTQVKTTANDGSADLGSPLYLGTERIGIGNSAPAKPLEVTGATRITRDSSNSTYLDITLGDVNCTFNGYDGGDGWMDFLFSSHGNTRLFIEGDSGNVGIGTSAPADLLHVSASAVSGRSDNGSTVAIIEADGHAYLQISTPSGSTGGVLFGDDGDSSRGNIAYNHATDKLSLRAGGTDSLILDASGNIGIGTTPAANAHLDLASASDTVTFKMHDDDTTAYFNVKDGYLSIGTDTGLTANNLNIKMSDGNVGIGIAVPATSLDVIGPISTANGNLRLASNNGTSSGITFFNTSSGSPASTSRKWGIMTNYANEGDLVFRMSSSHTGNLDSYVLSLDSTKMKVTGNLEPEADGTRNLGASDKRWANVYTADLHLKNDVGDWTVEEGAEELFLRNNLTGKKYAIMMRETDEQS